MKHTREQEQALIQRSMTGDGRAFEQLMKPHLGNIRRQVSSFYVSEQDTDDAVQDALIAIHNGLASFRGDSKFSVWCYAVAANAARALYNKNKRNSRMRSSFVADTDEDGESTVDYLAMLGGVDCSPEDIVAARQLSDRIAGAFESLTDEQREALMLREIELLSYEEIAEKLGCPVGSVKSRLHRARQSIEEVLH